MNKISCDVCLDLIPLVKDNISTDDSRKLVLEHIKSCEMCAEIYSNEYDLDFKLDSLKVTKKIKNKLKYITLLIIFIGIFLGVIITESMYVFYNVLLMPIIGALGYLVLKNKVNFLLIGIFLSSIAFSGLVTSAKAIFGHEYQIYDAFSIIMYAAIYTFFSIIGVVIAWLFCYSFKKENLL